MSFTSRSTLLLGATLLLTSCSDADSTPAGPASAAVGAGGAQADASTTPPEDAAGKDTGTPPPATKANVVFVLADDLAWNLVEYMPNLQQMQKEGVTFSRYFVTDSLCCPSRTSIMTGMFPHDSGIFTNTGDDGGYKTFNKKGNDGKTFAVALGEAGYRVALMGKYLNGYDPAALVVPKGWTDWAGGGNGYPNFDYDLDLNGKLHHYGSAEEDYLTDVVAGLGAKFVAADPGKPFLLEIATFAPHAPYTPAPRDAALFPGLGIPHTPAYDAPPDAHAAAWLKAITPLTKADKSTMDAAFRKRAQAVQAIDLLLATLKDAVTAAGQADSTYFVFSSDNGYHMGEHRLRPGKQTAFDTDIRVPLVVTGPGVPAGKTVDEIVQNIDLCATFAELGLTDPPSSQTGRSLVPLFKGESVPDWRDAALIEHHGQNFDPSDPDLPEDPAGGNPPTYAALRTKNSVYVEYAGGELEYHAHDTDPDELANTVGKLTAAQKAALHGTLEAMRNCHDPASCWTAQHLLPGAP